MYNPRKAAQVIAYMAMKNGDNTINILKAVKLVYLVDRESIATRGGPVLDEHRCSMPHGPVNSETYSHINGEHNLTLCGWADFLEGKVGHNVELVRGITVDDLDELSDADVGCLDTVWNRFGHMTQWQLRDWTHDRANIPEWEDPNGSSQTIPIERIMTMVGIDNVEEQARLLEDHQKIDQVFALLS